MHLDHIHTSGQPIDAAQHWMRAICGPHSLRAESPGKVAFAHSGHRLGALATTLGEIEYGTDVTVGVEPQQHLSSYSLSLPLTGSQELRTAGRALLSDSSQALIISPQDSQQLSISGNCRKVQIAITVAAMNSVAEHMLQRPLDAPIRFEPLMDALNGSSAGWWRLVDFHLRELAVADALYRLPGVARDLETTLIKALLLSQPSNYSKDLRNVSQGRIPHYLKRAREFIETHAREDLRPEEIAYAVDVSRARLFDGFRQHYQCTPMQMLKHVRLEAARRTLLEDGACSNVTEVAMSWGFSHLGRFSSDYHQAFGEYPSGTLARHAPRRQRASKGLQA
ncbi:AraC family transcriptional regulator [Pseudomonas syringae]|uniref:AraC family transcriptional regulator n=1 Tax=Pseudomonas syringae TaxID=317 RepID=UPI001CA7F264|nr:AraC family transcriptional regulator [Pseudomonas syringae]MCI3945919.1 AraC family transcriptional regulator [Pseudomonas syringae]